MPDDSTVRHLHRTISPDPQPVSPTELRWLDAHNRRLRDPISPGREELPRDVHREPDTGRRGPRHCLDQHSVPDPGATSLLQQRTRAVILHIHSVFRAGTWIPLRPFPPCADTASTVVMQSWGIVLGGTILQNTLLNKLPGSFTSQFPQGVQIAYAIIPTISGLHEPLKGEVRAAFAQATQLTWRVMIGIAGAGFLSVFLMKEVKLREDRDAQWGLQDGREEEKEVKEVRDISPSLASGCVPLGLNRLPQSDGSQSSVPSIA